MGHEALAKFYSEIENDSLPIAEDMLMDQLILAGPEVAPLVTEITDILRSVLQEAYSSYKESYESEISKLEKMVAWQSIKEEDRKDILADCNLQSFPQIRQ